MSQQFSLFHPNLLKNLEGEIFKFQHFGPPKIRLNIPCKYKNDCKYGRYACEYSHESLCRFFKKGSKCLNPNCTHQHELPLEFQLAQAFLNTKTQFSHDPASFEASKSAHDCNFLADSYLKNGTPENQVFCFKTHEASIKTHKTNFKNTNLKSIQHQRKAETHFTAFSPTFQIPAKPDIFSSNQNRSFTKAKPPQMPSKMDTYNLPINNFNSSSAHNQAKTSEKSSKAVH